MYVCRACGKWLRASNAISTLVLTCACSTHSHWGTPTLSMMSCGRVQMFIVLSVLKNLHGARFPRAAARVCNVSSGQWAHCHFGVLSVLNAFSTVSGPGGVPMCLCVVEIKFSRCVALSFRFVLANFLSGSWAHKIGKSCLGFIVRQH